MKSYPVMWGLFQKPWNRWWNYPTLCLCSCRVVVHPCFVYLYVYNQCRALRTSETILCLRGTAPTQCVRHDRWFQMYFMFTPAWWNDPIWQTYFLKRMAQPPTKRDMLVSRRLYNLSCSKKTWIYIYTHKNIYYMHRIYNMYICSIYTYINIICTEYMYILYIYDLYKTTW